MILTNDTIQKIAASLTPWLEASGRRLKLTADLSAAHGRFPRSTPQQTTMGYLEAVRAAKYNPDRKLNIRQVDIGRMPKRIVNDPYGDFKAFKKQHMRALGVA
jgi:hypothetical protein